MTIVYPYISISISVSISITTKAKQNSTFPVLGVPPTHKNKNMRHYPRIEVIYENKIRRGYWASLQWDNKSIVTEKSIGKAFIPFVFAYIQHWGIGSAASCSTAILSETSASDLRLQVIKEWTKKHVSSLVFPSGTSTTNDSTTNVPGLPSMISGCTVIIEA